LEFWCACWSFNRYLEDDQIMMKRLSLLTAGVAMLTLAAPLSARSATTTCLSGGSLKGSYGLEVAGFTTSLGKFLNGVVTFNGACGFTGSVTIDENSTVQSFVSISGAYSGNTSDNTISISFTLPGEVVPETYQVGLTPLFSEAVGIETDSSAVATISLKAQNYTGTYNKSSLYGTFSVSCIGAASASSDLNYVTFGAPNTTSGGYGTISGIDYYHNGMTVGTLPYVGLYEVGSNGAFGGEVSVGTATITANTAYNFGFSGVIDNNLQEIQFNYSTAAAPGVPPFGNVACHGKRV
jgi:hypothetical protein